MSDTRDSQVGGVTERHDYLPLHGEPAASTTYVLTKDVGR